MGATALIQPWLYLRTAPATAQNTKAPARNDAVSAEGLCSGSAVAVPPALGYAWYTKWYIGGAQRSPVAIGDGCCSSAESVGMRSNYQALAVMVGSAARTRNAPGAIPLWFEPLCLTCAASATRTGETDLDRHAGVSEFRSCE